MTVTVYPSLILVSDIIDGQYVKEKYIGYTQKQAEKRFMKKNKAPKSKIVKKLAKKLGIKVVNHKLAKIKPEDYKGLPKF
jgi:hypothetical protein